MRGVGGPCEPVGLRVSVRKAMGLPTDSHIRMGVWGCTPSAACAHGAVHPAHGWAPLMPPVCVLVPCPSPGLYLARKLCSRLRQQIID